MMKTGKFARMAGLLGMTALAGWGGGLKAAAFQETSVMDAHGLVVRPAASQPGGVGRAHTNVLLFFPNRVKSRSASPPVGYETPASLACVYAFVTPTAGCNPTSVTTLATGGSKLVVLVDAYDDPTAANDLGVYSAQFGLPAVSQSNFQVAYATGTKPAQDSSGGWELEESLDIEMAHALAPNAKVVLMEAASSNTSDLLAAETAAIKLAVAAGGGDISNSWGGGESANESSYENTFTGSNVVFFASTGASPGPEFPSVLQNVVAAGGTSINRNAQHNFTSQTSWNEAGGGLSKYITIPSYQSAEKKVKKVVGTQRGMPDFSFDANPSTGVVMYDTTPYDNQVLDWLVVGGTSVASPALAASINSANSFAASTAAELTKVYGDYTNKADWTDITSGACSNKGSIASKKGYDLCTGIGVPNGYAGK
jgi:kumamolisin